jgi:hypothetical protein
MDESGLARGAPPSVFDRLTVVVGCLGPGLWAVAPGGITLNAGHLTAMSRGQSGGYPVGVARISSTSDLTPHAIDQRRTDEFRFAASS